MDKDTFDKAVAEIWKIYAATKTINQVGAGLPRLTEKVQAHLRSELSQLAETLASGVVALPQAA